MKMHCRGALRNIFLLLLVQAAYLGAGESDIERTRVRTEKLWQRSTHQMASISVNNAAVGGLLSPLLGYEFMLPKSQLRAGLAYTGTKTRLRRFVRDLLTGRKPIKIGVVGGSITCGQGTSDPSVYGWFSVLGRWLVDSFPSGNVSARNGAVPATPSAYMIMCLEQSVEAGADLVLVEYQVNDGMVDKVYDNGVVRGTERLLRRLLALPGAPAVVLMQVPTHGMARDPPDAVPFHTTMEDLQGALSQYYDVQYLSLRTALWRLAAGAGGAGAGAGGGGWRWSELFVDHHPGDAGNRAMADLVAWLIQETALEVLLDPFGPEDERLLAAPLPPPMYQGNLPPSSPTCMHGEDFRALVTGAPAPPPAAPPAPPSSSLAPPPAAPPARPSSTTPSAPAAPPPASPAGGWEWVAEGSDPRHPKWGFVARRPGAELRVVLDTRRAAAGGEGQAVTVFFHHLRSYEHMGVALFSCVSGCSCEAAEVDAHMAEHVSQTYLASLQVSQSARCEVAVRLLERTSSGEHKFKVSGVVISESAWAAGVVERMADGRGAVAENLVARNEVFARQQAA